jgi:hypothetical protein
MLNDLPHAPATSRNREPIRSILSPLLQDLNSVFEIASGTGEHVAWLAKEFSNITWYPSDVDLQNLKIIDAYNVNNQNVRSASFIDATKPWLVDQPVDLVMCINMIHISPWNATSGLFTNSHPNVAKNGKLYVYGPFNQNGRFTSQGNERFHYGLQNQNPEWGLRDIESVVDIAKSAGWSLDNEVDMPANNKSLIFSKSP